MAIEKEYTQIVKMLLSVKEIDVNIPYVFIYYKFQ